MTNALSSAELDQYFEQGFLGPFTRFSPAEAAERLQRIESEVFPSEGPLPGHRTFMRHLDSRLIYDLCAHPTVVERVASIFGPDLMLWNTSFWDKPPGAAAIPWHQDLFYWPNDPPINLTAWLSLTESNAENACLQMIPGSQRKITPHTRAEEKAWFALGADPNLVDASNAVEVPLRPGEFVLFNERLLHGSAENRSSQRRLGYVARFTLPWVKLFPDQVPLFPSHVSIMVRGEDRFGRNPTAPPPG